MNQVDFAPEASKRCVLKDGNGRQFEVIRTSDLRVVLSGPLVRSKGHFGTFLMGDFTELTEPGTYYIRADLSRSFPFRIAADVYDKAASIIGLAQVYERTADESLRRRIVEELSVRSVRVLPSLSWHIRLG